MNLRLAHCSELGVFYLVCMGHVFGPAGFGQLEVASGDVLHRVLVRQSGMIVVEVVSYIYRKPVVLAIWHDHFVDGARQ